MVDEVVMRSGIRRLFMALYPMCFLFYSGWAHSDPVEHLSRAIQFDTVSYQSKQDIDYPVFDGFIEFLKDIYPNTFASLRVERIADYSLVLIWQGTDKIALPVLFDSHYDVVPIEPNTEVDWQHKPFSGEVAEGYIWGRGALDDKASVIATLEALESLVKEGYRPTRTMVFSFAHDEEIGGREGAANIARFFKSQGMHFEYMIAEGGYLLEGFPMVKNKTVAMINLAEKNYVTLSLVVRGEGGHSSMPPKQNSIVSLANAVAKVHQNPIPPTLVSPVSNMFEVIGSEVGGFSGWVMSNQWLTAPLLIRQLQENPAMRAMTQSTTAVTMFNGGVKENVVPQIATAKINFRLLPGYTPEELLSHVESVIDDPGIFVTVDTWSKPPPVADVNGKGYKVIEAAVEKSLNRVLTVPGLLVATTDTPHYADVSDNIYRFHSFAMHLTMASSIHGTNERIGVDSLRSAVELSRELITLASRP